MSDVDRELSILSARNGFVVRVLNRAEMYNGVAGCLNDTYVFETVGSMMTALPIILQRITPAGSGTTPAINKPRKDTEQ